MIEAGTMTPKLIDFGLTKEVARCISSTALAQLRPAPQPPPYSLILLLMT